MNTLAIRNLCNSVANGISKHSSEILTGLGITGMAGAIVMTVPATAKALQLIDESEAKTTKEKIKAAWKCYIPPAITACVSAACIIGASRNSMKRNAALATAYSLSESAFRDYKEKVVETLGKEADDKVTEAVAEKHIRENPVENKEIVITGNGEVLCYDSISGRYFESTTNDIDRAVNYLNRQMLLDMYVSSNDFYYEIGLDSSSVGDEIGWNIGHGYIEVYYTSHVTEDGRPCIVVNHRYAPEYGFQHSR